MQSARGALRFLITDAMEFNLIADVTNQHQKGPSDKYTIIDGTNGLNIGWNAVVASQVYGTGIGYDGRFLTNSDYTNYSRYDDPHNQRAYPNVNNLNHWGVSGTLEWKLTDNMNLKSITAYREFANTFGRDSDGSPLLVDATYDESRHRQFTQELQLTGAISQLDWALGAFYYDAHDSNSGHGSLYPIFIYQQDAIDRQDTDQLGNLRPGHVPPDRRAVLHRRRCATRTTRRTPPSIAPATMARSPSRTSSCRCRTRTTDYTVVGGLPVERCADDLRQVRHRLQGRRLQPAALESALQTEPFEPEELKTLEIGAKSELLDRRMRLNGALFLSDYINQQTFAQQLDASGRQLVPRGQRRQGEDLGTGSRAAGRARRQAA